MTKCQRSPETQSGRRLTVDVLLLGSDDLLSGRLADGLGEALAGQTVLGGHHAVHQTLSGHVRPVDQLVDVHRCRYQGPLSGMTYRPFDGGLGW